MQSGWLVTGVSRFDDSQRAYNVAYDLITLVDADKPRYQTVLADFIERLQNMADGKPVCNTPIDAVKK